MASRWRLGPGQALPDTLVEGTPEYREFREVMYERHLIRVHTHLGVYELSRPEPSRTGFTYESAEPVGGGRTATELPNPISFSSLTRIDVRKGHAGVGALAGFGVGFLAGHTFCKSGGLYGDCGNAGLAGLGVGGFFALIGLVFGESVYSWDPVYEAAASSPPPDPGSGLSLGFRIPLGGG